MKKALNSGWSEGLVRSAMVLVDGIGGGPSSSG